MRSRLIASSVPVASGGDVAATRDHARAPSARLSPRHARGRARAARALASSRSACCHLFIRHTSASLTHQRERLARRAPRLRDVVRRRRARGLPRLDAHARGPRRHAGPHQGLAAGAVAVAARSPAGAWPSGRGRGSTSASTATAAARARWSPRSTVSRAASRSASRAARSSRTSAGTPRGAGAMRSGSIGVSHHGAVDEVDARRARPRARRDDALERHVAEEQADAVVGDPPRRQRPVGHRGQVDRAPPRLGVGVHGERAGQQAQARRRLGRARRRRHAALAASTWPRR